MPGLALGGWVHGSYTDQVAFAGAELDRRLPDPGGDPGELRFALGVGVHGHVQLVRSHEAMGRLIVDAGSEDRLRVGAGHREFDRARTGLRVGDGDLVWLLRLGGLLSLRGDEE